MKAISWVSVPSPWFVIVSFIPTEKTSASAAPAAESIVDSQSVPTYPEGLPDREASRSFKVATAESVASRK
uniref:Uncharacterized protein n=1 Tax=uncultured marine virus TaxID=186617 RepID=A0A0F7L931_9VIRU|nr:hypothetical protein [uncultured marine virus]